MRLLGLDYGTVTVGVAMSDPTYTIAVPVETIRREEEVNLKSTVRRIRALCEENDIHLVVVGLPKNMNGTEGAMAEKARSFAHRLERDLYLVDVVLFDERLSTKQAEQPMLEAGLKDRKKRKETVDQMAASIVLQAFMDAHPDLKDKVWTRSES